LILLAEGEKKDFNLLNTLEIHRGLLEKATGGIAIVQVFADDFRLEPLF
jgi:hypothetical protein